MGVRIGSDKRRGSFPNIMFGNDTGRSPLLTFPRAARVHSSKMDLGALGTHEPEVVTHGKVSDANRAHARVRTLSGSRGERNLRVRRRGGRRLGLKASEASCLRRMAGLKF